MDAIAQPADRPTLGRVMRKGLADSSEILDRFYALETEVRQRICEEFGARNTRAREVLECRVLQNPSKHLEVLGAQFGVNKQTIRMQMGTVLSQLDLRLLQREYESFKASPDEVALLGIGALGLSLKGTKKLKKLKNRTIGDLKPVHVSRFLNPRLDPDDLRIFRSRMTELGYMDFPVEDDQLPEEDPYTGTRAEVLDRSITRFRLSARANTILRRFACYTVEQFLRVSDVDFSQARNCGEVTLQEIRQFRDRINAIPADEVSQ